MIHAVDNGEFRSEIIESMKSFLSREILKYLYLLFAEGAAGAAGTGVGADAGSAEGAGGELIKPPIDFESVIFTTEPHPIRKTW